MTTNKARRDAIILQNGYILEGRLLISPENEVIADFNTVQQAMEFLAPLSQPMNAAQVQQAANGGDAVEVAKALAKCGQDMLDRAWRSNSHDGKTHEALWFFHFDRFTAAFRPLYDKAMKLSATPVKDVQGEMDCPTLKDSEFADGVCGMVENGEPTVGPSNREAVAELVATYRQAAETTLREEIKAWQDKWDFDTSTKDAALAERDAQIERLEKYLDRADDIIVRMYRGEGDRPWGEWVTIKSQREVRAVAHKGGR